MADTRNLEQVRADIDAIDQEIQALISRRAQCAQRVAAIKLEEAEQVRSRGEPEAEVVFYRPEREAQVLRRIIERDAGPLAGESVAHVFREIMSACLALERPLQVAYLGPEGTFTQAASIKHFGHAAICVPQPTIDTVFAQVESGECNYGVVPVENSTEGMVSHTLDNFMDSPLKISGEVEMRICHHLLAAPGTPEEDVTLICAHQQALAQCRNWLDRHWPKVERKAVSSNGEAARLAATTPGVAAVAGDMAAELYQLQPLAAQYRRLPRQHYPVPGNRAGGGAAQWHGQDLYHRIEPQQARRPVFPAGPLPPGRRQPYPHRYPALAHREVGLCFLYRIRRAFTGSGHCRHRHRTGRAIHPAEATGVLSPGRALA